MKQSLKALVPLLFLCAAIVGVLFSSAISYAAPPMPPWQNTWVPRYQPRPRPPQPPPVVTPPSDIPTNGDVVGYIGCSMTQAIGNGLKLLGSTAGWQPVPEYGGAGVSQWWSDFNNKYWQAFDKALAAQPTTTILWELCALEKFKTQETLDNAKDVIDELKRRVPSAVIYVSAQPYYTPSSHTCNIAGQSGVDRMAGIVASLVSEGYAKQGPVFGPLAYPGQTIQDGCHPNSSGEQLMGNQFISFFLTNKPPVPGPTPEPPKDCTCTPVGTCTCQCTGTAPPTDPPPVPVPPPGAGIAKGIFVVDTEPGIDTALADRNADGLLVRSRWEQLEPTEGSYNFSTLCSKVTKAHNLGKQASLVHYTLAPKWLLDKVPDSEIWTLNMGHSVNTIVQWNQTGLDALKKLAEAEANFVCGGYPLKSHPAVTQIDTNPLGDPSIRNKPPGATLAQMTQGITTAVKYWRDAFAVPGDTKAYYISVFPLGRDSTAVSDSVSIMKEILKAYPFQGALTENWDLAGIGNSTPLQTAPQAIIQACAPFSNSTIKCSATGQSGNTPKAAYDKILKPLGIVKSLQIYAPDFSAYPDDLTYLHSEMNK